MVSKIVKLKNKLGMHARASSKFVELAKTFKSEIKVGKNGDLVNGKSILGLLMLAAACNEEIEIIAEGPDEEDAIKNLLDLVEKRFGEDE
jgi:phosphocarrier protein